MDNGNGTHFSTLLSEFVYVRTYARWLDEAKRRETWPETVKRYVDYYVRNNPKLQNLTFDLAGQVEQAILNKDVMPSMRSLWCAGPAMDRDHTCGYNCLGAETPFITQSGVKRFSDFQNGDTVTVLTHSGAWKQAVVRSYGIQKLHKVQIVRGTSVQHVRATRNHQWLLADGSRTSDLRVSDRLVRAPILVGSWVYEKSSPLERYYWALGYVYGDGTCVKGPQGEYTHSMVRLCGQDKARFLDRFQELGFATSAPPTFNGDAIAYTGHYLKTLPSIEVDGYENLVAFVRGYLDADGAKNTNPGSPSPFRSLQSSNEAAIEFIRSVFPAVGAYISREEDLTGQQTNFGVRPKTVRFALTLGFGASPHCAYSVKSITEDSEEEVWCLEVEDDHSFVLPNGIVTGNCSFLPIDNLKAFAEALYILMCGTGVGFSVERTFIDCLPTVSAPTGESTSYVIEDSTEGWADSLHYALVEGHRGRKVWFDYSKIRPKGARLRIKGGTASGPEPLERVHNFVASTLEKAAGRRLKPIEAHDIMCMIAEIVMVGGFRRASLISFSDPNDIEMRHAKDWRQGDVPTIRYMANNSAVWFERPNGERFREEWQNLIDSGSGERGFSIMNWDKRAPRGTTELRSNPCVTGDTRVLTASGYKMIQNFLGVQQGIVVDSRFGTEGAGHTTSQGAFKTGEREVFELTTQEGYKLKLTGDHKVMTPNGWVPAGKLAAGDKIHILNQGGGWGHSGSKELGAIAGWLAGDGCLLDGGTAARLYFYGEKRELVLRFFDYLNGGRLTTQDNQDRDYIDFKEAFQVLEISSKTEVPNLVWEGTKACQAAYLSALFSADGSIQGTQKKGISVRLSSVDLEHLRNVQLLLLNFGIYSKIYQNRQDAGYRMLPDGRGGLAEYACQAAHELVIANAGVQTYSTEIGFMLRHKAERLATVLSAFRRRPNTVKYLATVESLVSQGVQTVYDLTENTTHSFSANGIVVHNCHEIGLRFKRALNPWTGEGGGGQFCNLSATVVRPWDTQQTLAHKVRLATWLGCIQASYTHFPYLRPAWKQLCDEDRLLGVDLTGQCDNPELTNNEGVLTSLNAVARMTAAHASMTLDIREPVAITCGKPSGNSSQLANCASGFHPRYAPYYFRHVRVSAKDPLFKMIRDYGVPVFKENGQEHLPDDKVDVWVVRFPVKAPEGAMLRDHETALEQCERYLRIMRTWCGIKGHNQSATIYVRPDEWWPVGQWLYRHFDEVTGLSFLPHSDADTKYRLLPYQEITKEQYEEALAALPNIDFNALRMYETDDEGEGASEPACVGGACEL